MGDEVRDHSGLCLGLGLLDGLGMEYGVRCERECERGWHLRVGRRYTGVWIRLRHP